MIVDSQRLPLAGVRIVGFTHIGAGPYALSLLGDMGADAINIETLAGDTLRARDAAYSEISAYFLAVNRSKRSVSLDLKNPAGRDAALRLISTADAVLENHRPGGLERMGLGYSAAKAVKADIVYVSITPWGSNGPLRDKPGMDLVAQARGGMMGLNGMPGQPPVRIPPPIADFIAAYLSCYGLMLGLFARDRFGIGQHVETSLLGGQVATLANLLTYFWKTGKPDQPVGASHPQLVPYQPFRATDGYLIVACLTDKMWVSLCQALDRPDLAQDQHFGTNADRVLHRDELIEILESIIASKTRAEWESKLDAVGVPASRIQTLADVHADPQVLANEYIVTQQHPVVGEIRTAGLPVKLSLTPGSIRRPAPMRGEHTFEVLAELGMSPEQIAELVSLGGARLADEK